MEKYTVIKSWLSTKEEDFAADLAKLPLPNARHTISFLFPSFSLSLSLSFILFHFLAHRVFIHWS